MCGVLFAKSQGLTKPQFLSALMQMSYRGPDNPGNITQHETCWLGHNRLAILDLSPNGQQPFYSPDGRYSIVFNGEIYNYRELAQAHQIPMQSSCDTELLLKLYIQAGPSMLQHLNGMFAFVILDTQTGDIFAARDRLGIKPLYYYHNQDELIFSSEPAPILSLTHDYRIDEIGLRQYLKLRTFFNGRSLYQSIQMFPAGHYWHNGKLYQYWDLPTDEQAPPTDHELQELLASAVAYRCISDVPVGSYLSGGLDSSIIAALANKPDTWTVGFEESNEFPWAQQVAQHIHSQHHEIILTHQDFLTLTEQMIAIRKEPLSVPNEVLLYRMTQAVKRKNTVVLCGEGADELFFGYDRIFRWAAEQSSWNLKAFAKLYAYGPHEDDEIVADALSPFTHLKNPLKIVAAFFQKAHLHGLLRRLDFATMLCSVEARVPFVDHRLVERMAGVSFDYKMQDNIVKAPLKRCYSHLLPPEILTRKKIGFPVPLSTILGHYPKGNSDFDRWFAFNLDQLEEHLPHDCGLHFRRI